MQAGFMDMHQLARLQTVVALSAMALAGCSSHTPLTGPVEEPGTADSALPVPSPPAHTIQLHARLDPRTHRVRGKLRLHFQNTSARPLEQLVLHLYPNAFLDDRSVFFQERARTQRPTPTGRGGITLQTLRINGRESLPLARVELIPGDFTQLELPLRTPLAPGARLILESKFETRLPPLESRAGHVDGLHVVSQWFPKPARLRNDGNWSSHPYHGQGEFDADFARYELSVDVPADHVVAAPGKRLASRREADRKVEHYLLEPAHDIAWAAGPSLRERQLRHGGVEIRLYHDRLFAPALDEQMRAITRGLHLFSSWFGPYPYDALAVLLKPSHAGGAAGMEYPGFFVSQSPWWPVTWGGDPSATRTTAHELAHQWFQGMVANDEVTWPVLDEGLASWVEVSLQDALWRKGDSDEANLAQLRRTVMAGRPVGAPLPRAGRPAPSFGPEDYVRSVYAWPVLVFETLARCYGRQRVIRALGSYARAARFSHATPATLVEHFDREMGEKLGSRVLEPLLLWSARADAAITRATTKRHGESWRSTITLRREGPVQLPLELALLDAQGQVLTRRVWPAHAGSLSSTRQFVLQSAQPPHRVVLDPEAAVLVDRDFLDNVRVLLPEQAPTERLSSHIQLATRALLRVLMP